MSIPQNDLVWKNTSRFGKGKLNDLFFVTLYAIERSLGIQW
jgi:hypothetical protein